MNKVSAILRRGAQLSCMVLTLGGLTAYSVSTGFAAVVTPPVQWYDILLFVWLLAAAGLGARSGLLKELVRLGILVCTFFLAHRAAEVILARYPTIYLWIDENFPGFSGVQDIVARSEAERQELVSLSRALRDHILFRPSWQPVTDLVFSFPEHLMSYQQIWAWALARLAIVCFLTTAVYLCMDWFLRPVWLRLFLRRWLARQQGSLWAAFDYWGGFACGYFKYVLVLGFFDVFTLESPFAKLLPVSKWFGSSRLAPWAAEAAEPLVRLLGSLLRL